jgi:hypothetical protein
MIDTASPIASPLAATFWLGAGRRSAQLNIVVK